MLEAWDTYNSHAQPMDCEQSLFPLRDSREKANNRASAKIACRVDWRACRAANALSRSLHQRLDTRVTPIKGNYQFSDESKLKDYLKPASNISWVLKTESYETTGLELHLLSCFATKLGIHVSFVKHVKLVTRKRASCCVSNSTF